MHKAKGQAAGRNHAPATSIKRLVTLEEEGAIQGFPSEERALLSLTESVGSRPAEAPTRAAAKFLATATESPSTRRIPSDQGARHSRHKQVRDGKIGYDPEKKSNGGIINKPKNSRISSGNGTSIPRGD